MTATAPFPNLRDYPVFNFVGVRTDKSAFLLQDGELMSAWNVEFELGRVKKRLGSRQFGGFKAGNGGSPEVFVGGMYNRGLNVFLMNNKNTAAQNGMVYKIVSTTLTAAINTASTTITGADLSSFATPASTIEIEGDIINYAAISGAQFTGVTGITSAHSAGAAIHQWIPIYASAVATDLGVGYAYLNSLSIISRFGKGMESYNGTSTSAISTTGFTALYYPVTYKQRVYGVDDANFNRIRYSARNDGTSWTDSTLFIDVEDDRGEPIVGLRRYAGRLLIFKPNSSYYYNLSAIASFNEQVGTYNNDCHQEINGVIYTLCPRGAFVTNSATTKDIGLPIKKYLDAFNPDQFTPKTARLGDRWLVYLGDLTIDQILHNDVVLVYNTTLRSWTVWDGFTDLQGFVSVQSFTDNDNTRLDRPSLFWGDSSQRFYRFFNDRSYSSTNAVVTGGDISADKFFNTGTSIASEIVTKPIHQGYPAWWKKYKYLRVIGESWPISVSARAMTERGYTNWMPLGTTRGPESLLKLEGLEGYAIQIRVRESSQGDPWVLNGFILEETYAAMRNLKVEPSE